MIALPFFLSLASLFFCFLSTLFGSPNGSFVNLPPDYNLFGWVVRVIGAVLAVIAIYVLVQMHKQIRKGTFASFLGKASMVISVSCVVWELALIAAIIVLLLAALAGLAGGDGIDIDF